MDGNSKNLAFSKSIKKKTLKNNLQKKRIKGTKKLLILIGGISLLLMLFLAIILGMSMTMVILPTFLSLVSLTGYLLSEKESNGYKPSKFFLIVSIIVNIGVIGFMALLASYDFG